MLVFTGDINLTDWDFNPGFGIGSRIAQGFNPFAHLNRQPEDCWVGNFEGVASSTSNQKGNAAKIFRVEPKVLARLKHFDVYGFANNHAMQHGEDAYWNTVEALRSYGSKVFGMDIERTAIFEHQGRQVALVGMCLRVDVFTDDPAYWYNPEYAEIEEELAKLPKEAFKVLFVHWGNEYINRPSVAQKKFAHWLIDAGFDLIIGMHPHVLQGYEDYKGGRIYYSLGNFVFDMASEPCKYGAIVSVDFSQGKPVYKEEYVKIGADCAPVPIEEKDVPAAFAFGYLNEMLIKEDNSEEYHAEIMRGYKAYRKENRKIIIKNMFRHPMAGLAMVMDFVKRRL